MGGLNASLKGISVVVSLAWESITLSLSPHRFTLLANGFASGQKALPPPASPLLLSPKKPIFSLAFLLHKSQTWEAHT